VERQQNKAIRRNFFGALWHGGFLAIGISLTHPTTVLAAFISDLTASTLWVGGLSTVLTVAEALPQLLVARWIEPRPRKLPYLLLAIYLRVLSWGVLAWLIYIIGADRPWLLAWSLVGLLAVFYAGGGIGGVPYADIIGNVIPQHRRGAFFAGREALAGPLAIGAALLARHVLSHIPYPANYALLFGLAATALMIASLGFWILREPQRADADGRPAGWRDYFDEIATAGNRMKVLVGTQLLTGFSLMVLPFYIVYARQELGAPSGAIGWFIMAQALGGMAANLLWARLIDQYSSRRMLAVCGMISTVVPLAAIGLSRLGWIGILPVTFLSGAIVNGRNVGFSSALLEMAPAAERPTYAALNDALTLPIAFLPFAAGALLRYWSYPVLFSIAAVFICMGAALTRRLPAGRHSLCKAAPSQDQIV